MNATTTLSTFRAACLVAGAGMGTGVLSLPLAAQATGIGCLAIALAAACGASFLVYLVLSELTRRSDPPVQLLTILSKHLFTGRWGKGFRLLFFALFVFLLFQSLITYVIAAGQALAPITGWSAQIGMCVFCLAGLAISLFGLKTVAAWEAVSVSLIAVTIVTLTAMSTTHQVRPVPPGFSQPVTTIGLYALFVYAFSAIFAVVQVAGHVPSAVNLKKALIIGLLINAIGTLAFLLAAITASDVVSPVATVGLSASLGGPVALIASSVFILLAMLTSFWPSLIAFADVVREAFGLRAGIGQLLAAGPCLALAVFLPLTFLDYIKLGAGAVSLVIVLLIIPAYRNAIRADPDASPLIGRTGGGRAVPVVLSLIGLTMIVGGFL